MHLIPPFIYRKKNQLTMVLFVPLFCFAFILLYKPRDFEGLDQRYLFGLPVSYDTGWYILVFLVVLIGMAVLNVSRMLMGHYVKAKPLSYVKYVCWVLCEILVMTLIYTIFKSLISDTNFFVIFRSVLFTVLAVLLLPYLLCYGYFVFDEKVRLLNAIEKRMSEERYQNHIPIYDSRGEMRLTVKRENLIMLESADNYVRVWYLNQGSLKKVMVRNTLSRSAEQLSGTQVIRCHRSYMVNLELIKVMRRETDGIFIEFGLEGVPDVPISKTYSGAVTQWLMSGNTKKNDGII